MSKTYLYREQLRKLAKERGLDYILGGDYGHQTFIIDVEIEGILKRIWAGLDDGSAQANALRTQLLQQLKQALGVDPSTTVSLKAFKGPITSSTRETVLTWLRQNQEVIACVPREVIEVVVKRDKRSQRCTICERGDYWLIESVVLRMPGESIARQPIGWLKQTTKLMRLVAANDYRVSLGLVTREGMEELCIARKVVKPTEDSLRHALAWVSYLADLAEESLSGQDEL